MLTLGDFDIDALLDFSQSIDSAYAVYPIKMKGKTRWIEAPNHSLMDLQRLLLHKLFYRIAPNECAHGFVRGKSIVSNAAAHVGKPWLVTLDIKDFFPSISRQQVKTALEPHFAETCEADLVSKLVCRKEHLPQGAPTSPHLANLVFRPTDVKLADHALNGEWTYTRYADDLTFSGNGNPQEILRQVTTTIHEAGFNVSKRKTKIRSRHQRQVVTGLVVNQKLGIPKPTRRRLRAAFHNAKKKGAEIDLNELNRLHGQLSFAAFVDPLVYAQQRSDIAALV